MIWAISMESTAPSWETELSTWGACAAPSRPCQAASCQPGLLPSSQRSSHYRSLRSRGCRPCLLGTPAACGTAGNRPDLGGFGFSRALRAQPRSSTSGSFQRRMHPPLLLGSIPGPTAPLRAPIVLVRHTAAGIPCRPRGAAKCHLPHQALLDCPVRVTVSHSVFCVSHKCQDAHSPHWRALLNSTAVTGDVPPC